MPESFNRGTAFGQGFSLTSNASSNRRQVALMEKRNQQEQQRLVREDFLTKMKDNIAIVAKHTQDLVPGMFTEQELAKPIQKRGNTRAHQSFVQTTWANMLPAIEMAVAKGFISKDEAQIITKQYDIATTATDPRPAQDLSARGEQVGGQGKTLGKEAAISSDVAQANRDADNARAIKLRQTQTSQNISTTEMTPDDMRMSDSVLARDALKDYDRVNRQLRKAQNAFDSWKAAPGSGGITGSVAENIGGLIGQIPLMGEGMENGINLMLTGGTTAENTRARTNAITLASDMLSEITGEESGRFTEAERNLAFRALRQLSPSASIPQIASAYRTFIETSVNAKSRASSKMGVPTRFETESDGKLTTDGRTDYVVHLMKRGFTEKQAIDAVKRRIRDEELEGAN